ncbi:MAG: DMT family transporter [Flavobacteriales bacterium]
MNETKNSDLGTHFMLHFIVFIWGFTGILGKLITLEAPQKVWFRMLIAAISLLIYLAITGKKILIARSGAIRYLLTGLIVAAHWVTFFAAIDESNVSVALACISTTAFFTSFLEPIIHKRPFKLYEMALGLLVAYGIYVITEAAGHYWLGITLALTSACLAALFSVLNSTFVRTEKAEIITTYEMIGGFIGISLFTGIYYHGNIAWMAISAPDFLWLLVLGIVCTAFAFVASVTVMKKLTPFTVNMAINLEPIYAVLIALALFPESEKMTGGFYLGAAIIILSVVINGLIKRWERFKAKTALKKQQIQ